MKDFSLSELRVINAVAVHRSFRGGARDQNVAPSTASHVVASVEKRLGVRLFHRNTRSVALTEAGEAFLGRIRPALADIGAAIDMANDFRETPSGTIRINASEWAAARVFPVIIGFLKRYPEVELDLVTEGRMVDIVAEGFDAGLRLKEAVPQDMVAISSGEDEAFILVAAPAYLDQRGFPTAPADLLEHECIRFRLPSGTIMRWEVSRNGEASFADVSGRIVVGSAELALQTAAAGLGVAYVERSLAEKYLASGEVLQLLRDWTPPFEGVCLYYPRLRMQSAAFRAFVDYFRSEVRS